MQAAGGGEGTEMNRFAWGVFDLASIPVTALGDEARLPCALEGVTEEALIDPVFIDPVFVGVAEAVLLTAEPGAIKVEFPGLGTRGENRLMAINCGGTTGGCCKFGVRLLVGFSGGCTTSLFMP